MTRMKQMTRPLKGNRAGFTLVELLVVIVVIGFLAGAVVDFSISQTIDIARENVRQELLESAQTGLDRMANDIRLSASADDTSRWPDLHSPTGSSNLYGWQSNASTLVLATAAENSSNNVLFSDMTDYITVKNNYVYYLQNGTLYKRILAAPTVGNSAVTTCPPASATASCPADKLVLTNVQSLSVQYFDGLNQQVDPASAQSVQLTLVLQKTSFGDAITAHYATRMVFRNG